MVKGKDAKQSRPAKLTTFMLSQDYLPEHWDWSITEKAALGTCNTTAQVIFDRLYNAGFTLTEAYAITHDQDLHEIWDERINQYRPSFTSNHIHFLGKFADGGTLEAIAAAIGVAPNYIEKPMSGRYSYDNMLAYLIHIKYPAKHQYDPQDVITLRGRPYIDYFREGHKRWMHGRAERLIQEAHISLKDLKVQIIEGKISEEELYNDPRYNFILHQHFDAIDKLFKNHAAIELKRERINNPQRFELKAH